MRLEGYEVIERWPDNTWLARDADGSLVELVAFVVRENERGEATQRLTRLRKLAHPSLPRIIAIEGDPAVRGELVVVTEHRPRVTLARCAAASDVGLAVAFVCTAAHAVARALAELHAARIVHGRVQPACVGITADGAVALDLPRIVRTNGPREDVDDVMRLICALIAPPTAAHEEHDDPHEHADSTHAEYAEHAAYAEVDYSDPDDTTAPPPSSPVDALVARRADVPPELIEVMRATQAGEPMGARAFADALVIALPWAQWTAQNVLDEVRALLPDVTS